MRQGCGASTRVRDCWQPRDQALFDAAVLQIEPSCAYRTGLARVTGGADPKWFVVFDEMTPDELLRSPLPGADLVAKGLEDLRRGAYTTEALLVSIGRPRLNRLGFVIPSRYEQPEIRLYEQLAAEDVDRAYSRYNALIRRLVSFERAAECAL